MSGKGHVATMLFSPIEGGVGSIPVSPSKGGVAFVLFSVMEVFVPVCPSEGDTASVQLQ